jgi:hypothetical protein
MCGTLLPRYRLHPSGPHGRKPRWHFIAALEDSNFMTKRIRKAVFPVGGLGTRFLPATKAMPKEMLPVVDKPLIQYAVEEAAAAGIEDFIFVTGRAKQAIEDHFDVSFELAIRVRARRWVWAMRFSARASWWATSPSPCCWRTICSCPKSPACNSWWKPTTGPAAMSSP